MQIKWVIRNENDAALYWQHKEEAWESLKHATDFTYEQRLDYKLPPHGVWVRLVPENYLIKDLTVILEAARLALSDGVAYDRIAEQLDLNDDYLKEVQERLHKLLGSSDDV